MSDLKKNTELSTFEQVVKHYAELSISPSTKQCYERDWVKFHAFCIEHDFNPYPATPETVCAFIADSAQSGFTVATICRRLTSITALHEAGEQLSPVKHAMVARVLKGIKREHGAPPKAQRAISWSQLNRMVEQCDCMMIGRRDAAVLSLGWASALRRSELVALDIGDLEFSEKGVKITIRRSKTDQFGDGVDIAIPRSTEKLCPVAITEQWIERMGCESNAPLFPKLGTKARGKWTWQVGDRLPERLVSAIVKTYARHAKIDATNLSAHSLRRGFATEAGSMGVPERIIARHTRHKSAKVLRGYIDAGTIWDDNPLNAIYAPLCPIPCSN